MLQYANGDITREMTHLRLHWKHLAIDYETGFMKTAVGNYLLNDDDGDDHVYSHSTINSDHYDGLNPRTWDD